MRILTVTYVFEGTEYDDVDANIVLDDHGLIPDKEGVFIDDIQDSIE